MEISDVLKLVGFPRNDQHVGRGGNQQHPNADGSNSGFMPAGQNMVRKRVTGINVLDLPAGHYECQRCWGLPNSLDDGTGTANSSFNMVDIWIGEGGRKHFTCLENASGKRWIRTIHTGGNLNTGTNGWVRDLSISLIWRGSQKVVNEDISLNRGNMSLLNSELVLCEYEYYGYSYFVANPNENAPNVHRFTALGGGSNLGYMDVIDVDVRFSRANNTFKLVKNRKSSYNHGTDNIVKYNATSSGTALDNAGTIRSIWSLQGFE